MTCRPHLRLCAGLRLRCGRGSLSMAQFEVDDCLQNTAKTPSKSIDPATAQAARMHATSILEAAVRREMHLGNEQTGVLWKVRILERGQEALSPRRRRASAR